MSEQFSTGVAIDRHLPSFATFSPNGPASLDLGTTAVIEQIDFRLVGSLHAIQFGGGLGPASPVNALPESIEGLISNLRISGTAKYTGAQAATFCDVDAAHLAYLTRIFETTAPVRTDGSTAGAWNGDSTFESNFTKYFAAKRILGGRSAMLDARLLNSLTAYIQWRDIAALSLNAFGSGSALSNVYLFATLRTWEGGSYLPKAPYILQSQRKFDVRTSQDNRDFLDIPQDGLLIRQTVKCTTGTDDGARNVPTNVLIASANKVEGGHVQTSIKNYRETRYDQTYAASRAQDKVNFNLEAMPVGYTNLEYSRTGRPQEALDARGALKAKNIIDVSIADPSLSAVNTITITDERVVYQQ